MRWLIILSIVSSSLFAQTDSLPLPTKPTLPEIAPQVELKTNPTQIGVILPLSGPYAAYGRRVLTAIRMAFGLPEQKLASGMATLQKGERLSVVVVDSEGKASVAEAKVKELAESFQVIAILGEIVNDSSAAVASAAEKLGIPNISLSRKAGLPKIGAHTFRMGFSSEKFASAIVQKASGELKLKRFAIFYPKNAFGEESKTDFEFEVLRRKGVVTSSVAYDPEQTDFTKDIKKLLGKHSGKNPPFEALYIPDGPKKLKLILPALRAQDLLITTNRGMVYAYKKTLQAAHAKPVQLLGANTWNDEILGQQLGDLLEGALFCDGIDWSTPNPQLERFASEFEKKVSSKPLLLEIQAYDAAKFLKTAIGEAPNAVATREELVERLKRGDGFSGLLGQTRFDAQRDSISNVYWFTFEAGKLVPKTQAENG